LRIEERDDENEDDVPPAAENDHNANGLTKSFALITTAGGYMG